MRLIRSIRRNIAKIITMVGLIAGVIGAVISIGDDISFLRRLRDQAEPWSSIQVGLQDLETFNITNDHSRTTSQLDKGERGYDQLLRVIRRHMDPLRYGTPVALFAQPRGVKETIAGQFERQAVYFGIVNQDGVHQFLEDKILLDSWIREYRQQFYVMRGLTWILICFIVQLIAASLPANKPSGGNGKSPCLTRNVGHQEQRNVEHTEEFPQKTTSC